MNTKAATAAKKRVKNAIYSALRAKGVTGRIYRDENWQGVCEVVGIAKAAAGDAWVTVKDGGYRGRRKEYMLTARTSDGIQVDGLITCSAAGSVSDPFCVYDISVVMF